MLLLSFMSLSSSCLQECITPIKTGQALIQKYQSSSTSGLCQKKSIGLQLGHNNMKVQQRSCDFFISPLLLYTNYIYICAIFQKLAFYSKMQEAQEGVSSGSSFSNLPGASIKEEDCAREKDHPPEAEYINSRCVLFTYFQGDISSVVDEHFSRALSQPSSYVPSSTSSKSARGTSFWRGGNRTNIRNTWPVYALSCLHNLSPHTCYDERLEVREKCPTLALCAGDLQQAQWR